MDYRFTVFELRYIGLEYRFTVLEYRYRVYEKRYTVLEKRNTVFNIVGEYKTLLFAGRSKEQVRTFSKGAISKKLYSHNMGSDYKPFHNNRPPEGGLYDASKVLIYLGWSSRVPVLCNFRGYVRVFKQFTFSLFNVNIT